MSGQPGSSIPLGAAREQALDGEIPAHQWAKRYIRHLFQDMRIAAVFFDRELRVTDFTPGAGQLCGLTEGDLGRPIAEIDHRFGCERLAQDLQEVLHTRESRERQASLDAGRTCFMVRIHSYQAGADAVEGAVVTLVDITEIKQIEEQLARHARELARSNAELEQFASVISHDLRSPLLSITGCVQLLEEEFAEQLGPEAKQPFKYIREGVMRMGDLIKGLLDYSRMGPLKPTRCDSQATLAKAMANLDALIARKHARVTHDPLPAVQADERLLTQVFQNLLENALKYHDGQAPEVHVGVQAGEGEWTFSVRDNGIGIDPQHFQKIFQIFQRLHRDETKYSGLGVGLATCKKIVERHGGRMWVDSQPGQGSTFYFTLPK